MSMGQPINSDDINVSGKRIANMLEVRCTKPLNTLEIIYVSEYELNSHRNDALVKLVDKKVFLVFSSCW